LIASGLGYDSLKVLGVIPAPLVNKFHSLVEIELACLLIAQQMRKEYSFLWDSKREREILVNIIFVILSFNLRIFSYITALNYAFSRPVK